MYILVFYDICLCSSCLRSSPVLIFFIGGELISCWCVCKEWVKHALTLTPSNLLSSFLILWVIYTTHNTLYKEAVRAFSPPFVIKVSIKPPFFLIPSCSTTSNVACCWSWGCKLMREYVKQKNTKNTKGKR